MCATSQFNPCQRRYERNWNVGIMFARCLEGARSHSCARAHSAITSHITQIKCTRSQMAAASRAESARSSIDSLHFYIVCWYNRLGADCASAVMKWKSHKNETSASGFCGCTWRGIDGYLRMRAPSKKRCGNCTVLSAGHACVVRDSN